MATAADKKRWDKLRRDYATASEALLEYEIELGTKYGHNFSHTWLSRGQRTKLDRLCERKDKIGGKIVDLVTRVSPRGEAWLRGVPSVYIREQLTWEDVIRPANESLAVVPPPAYGYDKSPLAERRTERTAMAQTRYNDEEEDGFDFDDQDAVLAEVAKELDIDVDELDIVTNTGLEGFNACDVYEIRIKRSRNGKTWSVVENDEAARELAIAIVKQDLEEEPGNFNQSFIERHINTRRLKDYLESDVRNMAEEDLREMSDRHFWKTVEDYIDIPEESEDLDPEDYIEEVAEKMTEERLRDPMAYLEEIYGDEAVAKAIEIGGIDVEAAAEDAVDTDGEGHFLSHYDSETHTTPSGLVYWRDN